MGMRQGTTRGRPGRLRLSLGARRQGNNPGKPQEAAAKPSAYPLAACGLAALS
jgi:hypothetical protein